MNIDTTTTLSALLDQADIAEEDGRHNLAAELRSQVRESRPVADLLTTERTPDHWERHDWCNVSPSGTLLSVNHTELDARLNRAESDLPAYRNGTARPMTMVERAADSRRPEWDKRAKVLLDASSARAAEAREAWRTLVKADAPQTIINQTKRWADELAAEHQRVTFASLAELGIR
jgi:hypothetical protein